MKLPAAIASTLKNKRFWIWQIAGVIIYGIPAAIRFATGNVLLPILSLLATPWIDHYVPANLVEKILVNAFFPGGAGGIAGGILFSNLDNHALRGKRKYFARLAGALAQTSVWSAFQFWGNLQNIIGPYGSNIFEYPMVYPLNFLLASLSIFTPDIVNYVRMGAMQVYRRLSGSDS